MRSFIARFMGKPKQRAQRAAKAIFCNGKKKDGGELGIRTPDALVAHTRLAGEHLRPLGQLSKDLALKRAKPHNTPYNKNLQELYISKGTYDSKVI